MYKKLSGVVLLTIVALPLYAMVCPAPELVKPTANQLCYVTPISDTYTVVSVLPAFKAEGKSWYVSVINIVAESDIEAFRIAQAAVPQVTMLKNGPKDMGSFVRCEYAPGNVVIGARKDLEERV